jgi:hypothetical protein
MMSIEAEVSASELEKEKFELEVKTRVAAELEFRKRVVLADGGQVEKVMQMD